MDFFSDYYDDSAEHFEIANVTGFDECKDYSNEAISDYISETIPPEHFTDCSSITYNPENPIFVNDHNVLGVYNTQTHEIDIADENRFETRDEMLDTVVHEVGHNEYSHLETAKPEAINEWDKIHEASVDQYENTGFGFVSAYAQKDKYEDFAETYRTYIRNPELLQFMNEDKYTFMRDNVFDGREYSPQVYGDVATSSLDKQMGSHLELAKQMDHQLLENNDFYAGTDHIMISNPNLENVGKIYRCFEIIGSD